VPGFFHGKPRRPSAPLPSAKARRGE
jgi:hypothetical protein